MGTLWPKSGLIERDNNDNRAIAAKAYFYDAGTSTPKTVYEDAAETTPHTQPVQSDGNGRWPAVYVPYGSYKEVRTTSSGATIGDTIDDIPNPAPFDDTVVTDPLKLYQTGYLSVGLGNETRSGFVRLNGRTIGNAASGATERANADTADLFTHIYDRCSDTAAPVSGGRGASAAADYAANKTIQLLSLRGAGLRGFDDMGNSAASLLGSAPVVIGDTITPGSVLGGNTQTISTANLPSHTHTGTTAVGGSHSHSGATSTDGAHTHTGPTDAGGSHGHTVSGGTFGGTAAGALGGGAISAPINSAAAIAVDSGGSHTHTFTTTSNGSHFHNFTTDTHSGHTHTFTSDATGSGTAHNNVARDALVTFYIKL